MFIHKNARFLKEPKELTPDTMILGFTAAQWHEKLTGNMTEYLAAEKKRIDELHANKLAEGQQDLDPSGRKP